MHGGPAGGPAPGAPARLGVPAAETAGNGAGQSPYGGTVPPGGDPAAGAGGAEFGLGDLAAAERRQEVSRLQYVLGGLGERRREVLHLAFRHDLSAADLATVLRISHYRARAVLSRAVRMFAERSVAVLLTRQGWVGCLALDKLAGDAEDDERPLTPRLCRRIAQHSRNCVVCGQIAANWAFGAEALSLLPLATEPPEAGQAVSPSAGAPAAPPWLDQPGAATPARPVAAPDADDEPDHPASPADPGSPCRPRTAPPVAAAAEVRQPIGPEEPSRRRQRTAALVSLVALLLAAGVGIVAATRAEQNARSRELSAVRARDAATRELAAQWMAQEISRGTTVACDPAMCGALAAHGFPQRELSALGKASPSPLSADVVVETAFVHNLFGSSLDSYYAPAVIASFGSGSALIDVRQVAPHGVAAFDTEIRQDLQVRKSAGKQLVGSRQITLSATAMKQLLAGQPDARLLIAIALLASDYPIHIVGFGNAPGSGNGLPLRYVDLAATDQAARMDRSKYVQAMLYALRTQAGAYAPAGAGGLHLPGGETVFRIQFQAPTPLGLLSPQSSS